MLSPPSQSLRCVNASEQFLQKRMEWSCFSQMLAALESSEDEDHEFKDDHGVVASAATQEPPQ
jgi:hypothetical protein